MISPLRATVQCTIIHTYFLEMYSWHSVSRVPSLWFFIHISRCICSYCCSNYCDSNSCRSFSLLNPIATSKGNPIAIAFKSDCTVYILTLCKSTVYIGHYIFCILLTISMIFHTNFSLFNYCSFLLLKAIAKSKWKLIAIAFKSDCTIIHTYFVEMYSRHRPLYILYPAYHLHVFSYQFLSVWLLLFQLLR